MAAYEAAKIAHEEFELLLAQALGRPSPTRTEPKVALKKVTQADLDTIAEQAKESVIKPVRQSYLRADADPLAAAELERLYHEIEVEAEEIKAASQPGSRSAVFGETMKEHAEWVVKHHHFNAPPGSDEFGLIIAALRSGRAQGYAYVDKLRDGKITPTIPTSASIAKAATGLTLREVVERYKKFKGFGKKPASEIDLSLNIFESVVGNKSLAALTKSDFHRYVEHLADSTVGGKTAGSIKRAVSAQTVKKRLGILCTAINGDYPDGLLRTVQRRLKVWRSEQARALVFNPSAAPAGRRLGAETVSSLPRDWVPLRVASGSAARPPVAQGIVREGDLL
ncbi:hypothetical protein HY78_01370 [Rhizorhabdus wittichii DC-6]|nr:hypothetical protein HY78_01370 [Rhizorhabdus wittichii DC-6]